MAFRLIVLANVYSTIAVELELWAEKSNALYKSKCHWIRCSSHIVNIAVSSAVSNKIRVIELDGTDY